MSETHTALAEAMQDAGLDDTALGGRVGVSSSSISNYRRGLSTPRVGVALLIAEELGVDVDQLFPPTEIPTEID